MGTTFALMCVTLDTCQFISCAYTFIVLLSQFTSGVLPVPRVTRTSYHFSYVECGWLNHPGSGAHFYDSPSGSRRHLSICTHVCAHSIHLWCFARLKRGVYLLFFFLYVECDDSTVSGSGVHFYDSPSGRRHRLGSSRNRDALVRPQK